MIKIRVFLLGGIGVAALALFGRAASADMAPYAYIHNLAQQGQDVAIRVETAGGAGDSLADQPMTLKRVQGEEETVVAKDFLCTSETADGVSFYCGDLWYKTIAADAFCRLYPEVCLSCPENGEALCLGTDCSDCELIEHNEIYPEHAPYEDSFCDTYPAYLVDCDGDDEGDCCLECVFDYYFEILDQCVPPGPTEYLLFPSQYESYFHRGSLDVVDAGVPCASDTDGADTDTADPASTDGTGEDSDPWSDTATETGGHDLSSDSGDTESLSEPSSDPDTETSMSDPDTGGDGPGDSDDAVDSETTGSNDSGGEAPDGTDDTAAVPDPEADTESDPSDSENEQNPSGDGGGCHVVKPGEPAGGALWRVVGRLVGVR